ncbi:flagellar hook-length control protein FliK [Aporhodopirellula aestuarii]|uniref:Flagellar hook-length control protein FliK n=1 Tax=Aporhodopirellula aestuarii TaxID=2950107 RepID=A0ABT0U7C5_9BACT|nr:flagellar hook-length control protein FliK [Aporhodopirellula aestuarii]MCM2372817.1 flagellar hook-length control protein FliK [Aporhodopirellula aestuarii]
MTSNQNWSVSQSATRTSDSLAASRTDTGLVNLRRRIAAASGDDGGTALGLSDPFAEVFASIAAAETQPTPVSEPVEPIASDDVESDTRSETDDSEADDTARGETDHTAVAVNDTIITAESHDGSEEVEVATVAQNENADSDVADEDNGESESLTERLSQDNQHDDSDTDAPVVIAESETIENDSAIDLQYGVATTQQNGIKQDGDANAETAQTDVQVADVEEVGPKVVKADQTQDGDESNHYDDQQSASDGEESSEPRVERRRYSDRSDQAATQQDSQSNGESTNSQQDPSGGHQQRDRQADGTHSGLPGRSGEIKVSSMMSTVMGATSEAGVAAMAATRAATQAASPGVTGKAATGPAALGSTISGEGGVDSAFGVDQAGREGRDSKSAVAAKGSPGVDTNAAVQRAKLVQRVSRGFQHLGNGGGQIRMKLAPDHLGSVQLQLNVKNGELSGRMVTQSDAATQMLREQLPDLRAALENQGIKLQRIDIETETTADAMNQDTEGRQSSDNPGGHAGQQFAGGNDLTGGRRRGGWSDVNASSRNRPASKESNTPTSSPNRSQVVTPGRVDLQV